MESQKSQKVFLSILNYNTGPKFGISKSFF